MQSSEVQAVMPQRVGFYYLLASGCPARFVAVFRTDASVPAKTGQRKSLLEAWKQSSMQKHSIDARAACVAPLHPYSTGVGRAWKSMTDGKGNCLTSLSSNAWREFYDVGM